MAIRKHVKKETYEVVLSTMLREYWLPVIRDFLKDYRHPCGAEYKISFLDRDGILVRQDDEGYWRTVIVAICSDCAEKEASDSDLRLLSYNYFTLRAINLHDYLVNGAGKDSIREFGDHLKRVQEGTIDRDEAYGS